MSEIRKVRASDLFGGDANIHDTLGCACGVTGDKGISARGRLRHNETLFEPKRETDFIEGTPITEVSSMEYPNKSNLPKEAKDVQSDS